VTIHGDSNLVVNQLKGRWRIKKGLCLSIAIETKELLAYLRGLGWRINFCWIPRDQNKECDRLSKKIRNTPDSPHSLQAPALTLQRIRAWPSGDGEMLNQIGLTVAYEGGQVYILGGAGVRV
jgi:hypothetical protein